MFLRKILNLTMPKSSEKIIENYTFSAYNMLYNKIKVTSFWYKTEAAFVAASKLSGVKHTNVLRTIKVDAKNKKIITEQVSLFKHVFNIADRAFNKHCAYTLASVICFLHSKCGLGHNNISLESLFVTSNLNIVLGSFDKCLEGSFQKDIGDFRSVLQTFGLPDRPIVVILERRDWRSEFLDNMEVLLLEFSVLKIDEKADRIAKISQNKEVLGSFFRGKIAESLVYELEAFRKRQGKADVCAEKLKERVADLILDLDPIKSRSINGLFSILDPTIRLYLLRSSCVFSIEKLDREAVESILLGVKCRDHNIQMLTINFISKYYEKMTEKEKVRFIRSLQFLKDRQMLGHACKILEKHREADNNINREVYKFIEFFLPIDDLRLEVLPLIKGYYGSFSYSNICSKIAPAMFEFIRFNHTQKAAFEIIELLVERLKNERANIIDKNWRIPNLKALFFERKPKIQESGGVAEECVEENTSLSKTEEDIDDGWGDDW